MKYIELQSKQTIARIVPEGAWLTELSDKQGDILYPKQRLLTTDGNLKARGGCHVCLPNFGPGGDSDLPQHGFGRTETWEVAEQTENSVKLVLRGGAKSYESLVSNLVYELSSGALDITLQLENIGDNPLRVAPGFHPYFALPATTERIEISREEYKLSEIGGTLFRDGQSQTLIAGRRRVKISSENLSKWAIWTDQLDDYVCIEPTAYGNAFLNKKPISGELLQSQDKHVYSCQISWINV